MSTQVGVQSGLLLFTCAVCLPLTATAQTQNAMPLKYTLTIYVDEGNGAIAGHVFVELSDGKNHLYHGFYPEEAYTDFFGKEVALLRLSGEFRDDGHHPWDVKRSYNITKDGFEKAERGVEQAKKQGSKWWLTNHCGDFAERVAKEAGVPIQLPLTVTGRDRPAVFGSYLREHGGVTNSQQFKETYPDEDFLSSLSTEAVQARRSMQSDNDSYEVWLHEFEATLSRIEENDRQFEAQQTFKRELIRRSGEFGYLAAAAQLACANPSAFEAEVRRGRYSKVGMEGRFLAAYLAAAGGDMLSPCQIEVLNKLDSAGRLVSWQDVQGWASEYRSAHPTLLARAEKALGAFRDSFKVFESNSSSGSSPSSSRERSNSSDREQSESHDMRGLNTRSGSDLRGIGSGRWK
jgi:hypothetical protein